LFEEIEKLSHLVWDGVPNKFYYLVEKFNWCLDYYTSI
jgi:hypothetical protein